LLKQSQISLFDIKKIACTIGPGSFTGIRVGLTACRTLAQQLNIPLVGISTLDILAYQTVISPCDNPSTLLKMVNLSNYILVCPIISALPEKVYTAVYRIKKSVKRLTDYRLVKIQTWLNELPRTLAKLQNEFSVSVSETSILFTGDAVSRWGKLIKEIFGNIDVVVGCGRIRPVAEWIAQQSQFPKASTLATIASGRKGNVFSRVKPLYINPPKIRQVTR